MIEIRSVRGSVLFTAETASDVKEALKQAMKSSADLRGANLSSADLYGADLRGANLRGANLRGATLSTGEKWEMYLSEVLPALLKAGGKELAATVTAEVWDCHSWSNCPMACAFESRHNDLNVPLLLRPRADQFIQFFDARLISLEVARKACGLE